MKYRLWLCFQSMLLFDVEACWNHAWMMFDSLCLATFWTLFTPRFREVEVGSGSAAARAAGTQRNFQQFQLALLPPTFSTLQQVSRCFQWFFPTEKQQQHQWNHCSGFLKVDFPAPRRRTSPGRLVDVCVDPLILVGKKRLEMTFWWWIPIIFAWERGGNLPKRSW